jgi:hypothetical protein
VSFRNVVQSNVQLDEVVSLPELQEGRHELEEADQQIILHAIDIGRRVPQPKLNVYSLDTDVLVLLTGFHTQIPSQTTVIRNADEKISISEIYYRLGCHRAEALIGWYAFKGCDNTGSFSTKSLKSNFSAFLASDADILSAFSSFGTDLNFQPHIYKQMERYVCLLYRQTIVKRGKQYQRGQVVYVCEMWQRRSSVTTHSWYTEASYKQSVLHDSAVEKVCNSMSCTTSMY